MRERRSTLLLVTALLPVVALAGACGKLKPADATDTGAAGNGDVHVTISGTAAPHPLNKALLKEDEDFSMLKVAIIDPSAVIADPTTPPLGSMTLDMSTGNCDMTAGCSWRLEGVDITNLTLGLVGTLEDTRTGDARVWVKTGTGMGTATDLAAVRMAPDPIIDRRAFAVSRKLTGVLAAFVSQVQGGTALTGDDLEARGFLIGHIVGKVVGAAVPDGVEGATVAATGSFDVIYPTADFSGAGAKTAKDGIFLMVPKTAAPVVTMWDVVPPAGDTRTWEMHLAGANPGNAFVIIMPAND
jgi:hypothetical protein